MVERIARALDLVRDPSQSAVGTKYCASTKSNGDELSQILLNVLSQSREPLETKEIETHVSGLAGGVTRIKVFYRLQNLRAEGRIRGKFVGPGKGVWVWWTTRASIKAARQLGGAS